jgi:bifunctional DNase/RNase
VVNDLRNDTFYARIVIQMDSRRLEIDSRPSDAIALAVRARVPIYVDEDVMERAGVNPREEEIESESLESPEAKLEESPFRDLIESLDLDDLGEGGEE